MTYEVVFSPKSYRQIKALKDKKLKEKLKMRMIEKRSETTYKSGVTT